jgi:hypothetical protein
VALVLKAQPLLTFIEVRDLLRVTADQVGDGDPNKYGAGLVDAELIP